MPVNWNWPHSASDWLVSLWLGPCHCLKESQPTEHGRRNCHHWGQDGCFYCPVEPSADAVGCIWPHCECKNKRRDTNCLRSVCKQPADLMLKRHVWQVTKTCSPSDKDIFAKKTLMCWQSYINTTFKEPPPPPPPPPEKGFYTLDVS